MPLYAPPDTASPWTAYSPSLTVESGTALGTGNTITGAWKRGVGKTIHVRIKIVIGASGIGGATALSVSLPSAAIAEANLVGNNWTTGLGGSPPIGIVSLARAMLYTSGGGALVSGNGQTCIVSGTYEDA